MRKVKETTWEFTIKKDDGEGTVMDTITKTVQGSYPTQEQVNELRVDGWEVTVMTLTDTNYE